MHLQLNEKFKYYLVVIYDMYEDAEFQALSGLYGMLERHKIPREKTIVIGSYVQYLQGKLRKGDKPSDIDLIVKNEEDFNQIIEALDKEGMELTFSTVNATEIIFDFIRRDVLQFKYKNQDFDIFQGDNIGGFLSGNVDTAEKVYVKDEVIYVRPLELIKKDIENAIKDTEYKIERENISIGQFRQRNIPSDTADDIAINEAAKRLSDHLFKYKKRLNYLNASHC